MNTSHLIILNRAPLAAENGWIHIVPKGELPNREAGIVQVLDDTALDAILAGIAADKERLGNRWPGIYAGEEHFFYQDDQSTAAFAWFKEFEKRADGIWAKADGLTDLGEAAVRNRRFKFTSFVSPRSATQKLDGNRERIVGIETIGFTNAANGRELLTPITNRGVDGKSQMANGQEFRRGLELAAGSAVNNRGVNAPSNEGKKRMKSVATKLGLSADASEEAVLAEVTKIMNRAAEAEAQVVPITLRVTTLENENTTLRSEQIEADLASAGVTDTKIVNRVKPLLGDGKHFKNREERVAFIADLVPAAGTQQKKLTNRETKAPGTVADQDGERSRLVEDYKIRNRCTFESAWSAVRRERPELFAPKS